MKDRAIADEVFDKLHEQGGMRWSDRESEFGFPVFIVWRTLTSSERKPRVVVDFRALNKISVRDSYPLPRHEDIIAFTCGALRLSVFNALQFFY